MRVLKRGHQYEATIRWPRGVDMKQHGDTRVHVQFVNLEPGQLSPGTTTQDLCRILIDRTTYCNNCLPHRVNEQIIWHFRQIIALHEARAIEQKAWKGELKPEFVPLAEDEHFALGLDAPNIDKPGSALEEYELKPVPRIGAQTCDHRSDR